MAYKNYEEYIAKTGGSQLSKEKFDQVIKERQEQELADSLKERREDSKLERMNSAGGENYLKRQDSMNQGIPMAQSDSNQVGLPQNQTPIGSLQQQIVDAQKRKQISAIEQAYQKNVGGLQAEKATVDPMFAGQTRQAVTKSAMAKKSFSDFLAEKGLSTSGSAGQSEIAQNVALGSQLGDIEARRGQTLSDIARRTSEVEQARQFGIQGAESDAALTESQSRLNEMLRQQEIAREDKLRQEQFGREDARTSQDIARQDQLRQQAILREDQLIQQGYTREDAQRQADLERQASDRTLQTEISTIGRYSDDFAAERLRREATPDTADDFLIPYLAAEESRKKTSIKQSKADQEDAQKTAQQKFAESQYDRAMEIWKTTGVANDFVSQTIGVPKGTPTNDADYRRAQLKFDEIRANKTSLGGSGATEKQKPADDYKAFEADFRNLLLNDPAKATNLVKVNREELIRQKGLSTYNSLLSQAEKLTLDNLNKFKNSQYNFIPQP